MYEILHKETIAPGLKLMEIYAPQVAEKVNPGQFVILRVDEEGERIPMSIADWDRDKGTLTIVYHELGTSTKKLALLEMGEKLVNLSGPLGKSTEIKNYGTVVCVGGCFGIGPAYALAKALKRAGNKVIYIVEAREGDFIFWEDRLEEVSDRLIITSGDGTRGSSRWATKPLREVLETEKVNMVYLVGCTFMLMTCSKVIDPYGIEAKVSLMPIMIDGTGMCGACRVTVGGETKMACVDGPEFDGREVDWNELMDRARSHLKEEERSLDLWVRENWHKVRFRELDSKCGGVRLRGSAVVLDTPARMNYKTEMG